MRYVILYAAGTLAFAGTALAQDLGTPATNASPVPSADRDTPTLASVDKDGDGVVNRREAASSKVLVKEFQSLDRNRDGKLDKGEFARLETESMKRPEGPEAQPAETDPAK